MATKTPRTDLFNQCLTRFLANSQAVINESFTKYEYVKPPTLVEDEGLRYVRIWSKDASDTSGSRGSAWAFIDKTNGDILKPDGWKKPAKHARGNIYAPNAMEQISWTGPAYLK